MSDYARRIAALSPQKREMLARRLREQHSGSALPPLRRRDRTTGSTPASFEQQRLWFLAQLEADSPAYHIVTAVKIIGELDAAALEESLNELVRRHESLRTTFAESNGQPLQIIAPAQRLQLPVADLRHLPEADRATVAAELAMRETQTPFDLVSGPLLRVKRFHLAEQEHLVICTLHHIIADGLSCAILNRELSILYEAYRTGRPRPLPEMSWQFADFAAWQHEILRNGSLTSQLDYWKRQFAAAPPVLEFRTGRPRPSVRAFRGGRVGMAITAALTNDLKALCGRRALTLFIALLAAFKALLFCHSGQPDLVVGAPITNRNWPELEAVVGLFVNTLALRANLSGDPSLNEILKRVRQVVVGAFAHRDVPLNLLVSELQVHRALGHTPLFQVAFTLQREDAASVRLPDLTFTPLDIHSGTVQFDLVMNLTETAQGLVGSLEYSDELFDPATAARLTGHYQFILAQIVARPEMTLSELVAALGDDDRRERKAEELRIEQLRREKFKQIRPRSGARG